MKLLMIYISLWLFSFLSATATETGLASFYTTRTNRGITTASGIPLNDSKLTAAHRYLKFGTQVRVTCQTTGRSVVVTITDRGPFVRGRIIDLSLAAARKLNMEHKGIIRVKVDKV